MKLVLEALKCPNCGAPLKINPNEEFTFCLYCNSSIHVSREDDSGEHRVSHTEIPEELIKEVRQLLLSGKKDEAIDLYQKTAGTKRPEAEKMIESILGRATDIIILSRPLSTKGIIFCFVFLLIICGSVYFLVSGLADSTSATIFFWVLFVFSLLNFLSLGRSIIATIKYFPAKWTKATVLKFVFINQRKKLSFYKVLLDVIGYDGQSFQAETRIVIKTENAEKLREGKTLDVKYIDKDSVVASVKNL